jgi:outer membrane protein insertion porin family
MTPLISGTRQAMNVWTSDRFLAMKKNLVSKLLHLLLLVTAFFASGLAHSFDPFVVRDIRVEGIQRIEAGTVFNYLPVKVGETMTDEKAAQALRALFGTGFFRDVRLEVERDVLIVVVEERAAIAAIDFVGMKEIKPDDARKALRESGFREGRIFDRAILDQAEQEIKRQYLTRGYYGAQVTTTVTPLERNRVSINFSVNEGDVAKIKAINIVGNQAFSEEDLVELFALRTPGWFTWYTKNDQYSRQKLQGDLDALRSHYLDRGYLDFNIDSTQVSITPDKRDIFITVNITEGEKYTVSDVKLGGEMLVPEEELRKLVVLKVGEPFSREKLNESTKAITDRLGREGYAFANANGVPEIDREKRLAAFTIRIDPGRRVYVRRINVAGNSRTRDEVIRREMRQLEGAFYDTDKIQQSKRRLGRTGFFSDVEVETPPVQGTSDQVDVSVSVKEKPTGAILLGLGISSTEKLVASASVQQENVLGTGKSIGIGINTSKINTNLGISYNDPYYTLDGVSRGFDVYFRRSNPGDLGLGAYRTQSVGAGVSFGYPVTNIDRLGVGFTVDRTNLDTGPGTPPRILQVVTQIGSTYTTLLTRPSWTQDSRDSVLWPTTGLKQALSGEIAVPPGDLQYYKISYVHQRFIPITRKFTLMLNGEASYAHGYGNKSLPIFKNLYAGGANSVRGFDSNSLGPKDTDGSFLGGTKRLVGNMEALFPMPGSGKDQSMRLSVFLDAGQVYGDNESLRLSTLRYSSGVGLSWISPFGPMKINLAVPLNDKPDDRTQRFAFQLGQTF